jgi:7-cyano-7-deazaguanine synthase
MEYKYLIKYCNENSIEHINRFDFSNFGRIIRSGITDSALDITEDAFTPNRNLLFILLGSSIAAMEGVDRIVMGLLSEETCIFPDQTDEFITSAEQAISLSTGRGIKIELPLRQFSKSHVISLAKQLGVKDTYSCHRGGPVACGECISCREFVCDVPN